MFQFRSTLVRCGPPHSEGLVTDRQTRRDSRGVQFSWKVSQEEENIVEGCLGLPEKRGRRHKSLLFSCYSLLYPKAARLWDFRSTEYGWKSFPADKERVVWLRKRRSCSWNSQHSTSSHCSWLGEALGGGGGAGEVLGLWATIHLQTIINLMFRLISDALSKVHWKHFSFTIMLIAYWGDKSNCQLCTDLPKLSDQASMYA